MVVILICLIVSIVVKVYLVVVISVLDKFFPHSRGLCLFFFLICGFCIHWLEDLAVGAQGGR